MTDWPFHFAVNSDIERIRTILDCNIFASKNIEEPWHPLYQSAFIELMISLNDLLQKCKHKKVPVVFTDAVDISPKIGNVTDLVSKIRNAVCHIESKTYRIQ